MSKVFALLFLGASLAPLGAVAQTVECQQLKCASNQCAHQCVGGSCSDYCVRQEPISSNANVQRNDFDLRVPNATPELGEKIRKLIEQDAAQ